jgi:hypothetical protein
MARTAGRAAMCVALRNAIATLPIALRVFE